MGFEILDVQQIMIPSTCESSSFLTDLFPTIISEAEHFP